jgi:hypothetical protein
MLDPEKSISKKKKQKTSTKVIEETTAVKEESIDNQDECDKSLTEDV